MKKHTILIADDHAVVRFGLSSLIERQKDLAVVGQAKNGEEAVRLTAELKPELVIMDLAMPKLDGVGATRQILEADRSTTTSNHAPKILVLTSFGTSDRIQMAIDAGADGVVMKSDENGTLLPTIRRVLEGERVISDEVRQLLEDDPPIPELTGRQLEILASLSDGLGSKQIAEKLGIRSDSVDKHIKALIGKIGASNRTEAVAIALRKQLLKI